MRIQRPLALLAVAPLFLGACSGSSVTATSPTESSSTPSTTETTAALTSTTSTPVSTTTTPSVEVLLPGNDVDDPTEAIVAILDYVSYLHTIPEQGSDYLDLVYLETCGCYEAVLGFLVEYVSEGWVQDDDGIVVTDVLISQEFENGDVLLQVTDSWAPQYVRDESGARIRLDRDDYVGLISLMGLERGNDGRWRVAVIEALGEITEGSGE